MKVKDLMTKSIASLNPEDTIEQAAHLMKQYDIGSIPVCSGEKVIGIITDRDITLRSVAEGENVKKQTVREIMTSNPVTCSPDTDIHDATRIMSERQIRRIPIVDQDKLIGMLSLGDVAVNSGLGRDAENALSDISEPCVPTM
ncbi:MAG: CBS domain-containing protein [Bacillota bacterium]|nr:CBS domain-containing protein [Bacillota bacterium]